MVIPGVRDATAGINFDLVGWIWIVGQELVDGLPFGLADDVPQRIVDACPGTLGQVIVPLVVGQKVNVKDK